MKKEVEIDAKGTVVLCDAGEIGTSDLDADGLQADLGYRLYDTRLFYFEPRDMIAGRIRVLVGEPPPREIVERASKAVKDVGLEVPSGELCVCLAYALAHGDRDQDRDVLARLRVAKGSFVVDAYLPELTDEEIDGPRLDRWTELTHTLAILSVPWFLFSCLVYGMLAWQGYARDALQLYLLVGVAPMVVANAVYRISGGATRVRHAEKGHARRIAHVPHLLVVLRRTTATLPAGGGIIES
jgi:hypothetical protein